MYLPWEDESPHVCFESSTQVEGPQIVGAELDESQGITTPYSKKCADDGKRVAARLVGN